MHRSCIYKSKFNFRRNTRLYSNLGANSYFANFGKPFN